MVADRQGFELSVPRRLTWTIIVAIVERDSLTTHVDGAGQDRAKSVASNFNNHSSVPNFSFVSGSGAR